MRLPCFPSQTFIASMDSQDSDCEEIKETNDNRGSLATSVKRFRICDIHEIKPFISSHEDNEVDFTEHLEDKALWL